MTGCVIIPVYNRGRDVAELMKLAARDPDRTYLFIDDGSRESCYPEYKRGSDNVLWFRQSNAGVGGARNAGLLLQEADTIFLLDSDDRWLSTKQCKTMHALRPHVGCVSHEAVYLNDKGNTLKKTIAKFRMCTLPHLLRANHIPTSSFAFCSRLLDMMPRWFVPGTCFAEDWDFFTMVTLRTMTINLPEHSSLYPESEDGLMGTQAVQTAQPASSFSPQDPLKSMLPGQPRFTRLLDISPVLVMRRLWGGLKNMCRHGWKQHVR